MITLRELTMLQLMNSITDKPDWYIKINNPEIAQKWKDEALASGRDVTERMINWCINELKYNASLIPPPPALPPPIFVYNGDVFKSDYAVSGELKKELQEAVKIFEAKIPGNMKDWHPGSEGKVWDLVHPSIFPLVYGHTRVLANGEMTTLKDCIQCCGQGEVAPIPPDDETEEKWSREAGDEVDWLADDDPDSVEHPFSAKFQWLPCEVDIKGEAKIKTYINNLHPQEEQHLYNLVEKLISASIPLWDRTIAPLQHREYFAQDSTRRLQYKQVKYDPFPERMPKTEGPQREDYEDQVTFWDQRQKWYDETRRLVFPEPPESFIPVGRPLPFSLRDQYGARGLQVIVKLANIQLTPEKPEYGGGTWHVEGQLNEHIVATSLYYYSCENVTTSTLSFRHQCRGGRSYEISYEQWVHDWLPAIFGMATEGPAVQEIGNVETREGRLLTFPNILQHRVGPFRLADPKKPGHRKIVALFLVDPNIKVISTANVPCQQQAWWWQEIVRPKSHAMPGLWDSRLSGLPAELQDQVLEDVNFPICLQEAKQLRLQLIEERKGFVKSENEAFESRAFNLCEH
ncbi:hypothetical protein CPB84DRAFT_138098 [Gymnopilus junonius]|uniref:Uncharacterized protein n=1 Tax=Gymnopilus junonius TaxID=109634 RepID=A0A9P5TJY4_GYMJU|nr:hypothetical protein CPB84DRAFT_138098 [Gymnopilus junonius]